MKKIAVIGGGPAGIIAAGSASSHDTEVHLLEKNKNLGKKLLITGKGRCNITNAADISEFIDQIPTNNEFMYSSLYTFTNIDILNLLSDYGLEYKTERGNRIFTKKDDSKYVLDCFIKYLKDKKVIVRTNKNVFKIYKDINSNKFYLNISGFEEEFDAVIIATGGMSYKITGSDGNGYILAKKLGHNIIDPKPALSAINIKNHNKELQGLSLKNINLRTFINDKLYDESFGEMLFTHYGISGPIVLSLSSFLNKIKSKDIKFFIDLKPGLTYEQLNKRVLKDFNKNNNKILLNSLNELLPKKIILPVINKSGVDQNKFIHQISKRERLSLIDTIKSFELEFDSFRDINESIITSGGIDVKEIDPSTLESKIQKNLFFAGEIIDVDALTGGYNLQIAYSTGYLAGINAKKL